MIYEELTLLTQLNYYLEKSNYNRAISYTHLNLRIGVKLCNNLPFKSSYKLYSYFKTTK